MKRLFSKVTAVLIMLSMLVQLIPALPAQAAGTAENVSITFTNSSYNYGIESGKTTDFSSRVPETVATLGDAGWAYNDAETSDAVAASKYTGLDTAFGARAGFENGQESFALNVKLNPGKYKVDMALSNFGERTYPLDIAVDGKTIATGVAMGNAVTVSEYVEVTSNDGYAVLKFTDTSSHTESIRFFSLQSVSFTVVEELPAEPVSIAFKDSQYNYGIESGKTTDFSSRVPSLTATLENAGWAYNGTHTDAVVAASKYTGLDTAFGARAGFENGQESFALNVKVKPGKYKVDMVLSNFGEATYPLDIAVDGKTIATGVAMGNAVAVSEYVEVTSDDGYATLKFTDTSSHSGTPRFFCLQSVSFTVVEALPAKDMSITFKGSQYNYGIERGKTTDFSSRVPSLTATLGNAGWAYNGTHTNAAVAASPYTGLDTAFGARAGFMNTGESFALDVNIAPGTYEVKMQLVNLDPSREYTLDITVDGTKIGNNVVMSETVTVERYVDVKSSSGYATIVFTDTCEKRDWTRHFCLQSLEFKTASPIVAEKLDLNIGTTTILSGESTDVAAHVYMSDGNEFTAFDDENTLEITSSDPKIAKIDNGRIIAGENGRTEITASAFVGGVHLSEKKEVYVIKLPEAQLVLTADKMFPVAVDSKAEVLIQAALSNIIVDLNKAESITAKSSDDAIATAEIITKDGNVMLQVAGVLAGDAVITVNALYEGVADSVDVPVKVVDAAGINVAQNIIFGQANKLNELELETHGIAIDDRTNPDILTRGNTTIYKDWCIKAELEFGEAIYLQFNVAADGNYALDFTGTQVGDYGLVGAFYIDDEFIGEFDFSYPGSVKESDQRAFEKHFRDISLSSGVHTLKVERVNDDEEHHGYMWMERLRLTPVAGIAEFAGINVDCKADSLLPGDSEKVSFGIRMSDGRDFSLSSLVENQGGLSWDVITPERVVYGSETGTIIAKDSGLGVVEILAELPDMGNVTAYWQINVAEGQLFDFKRTSEEKPANAKIDNDNWQVNSDKTTINFKSSDCKLNNIGFNAEFTNGGILALDLNIAESGVYDVNIVAAQIGNLGSTADFYVDDTYLGRFDFSNSAYTEGMTESQIATQATSLGQVAQLNTVELDNGQHTLYVKRINDDSDNYSCVWIDRLVLIKADKLPDVANISIQAESNTIDYKKTLKADVTVWMTNGRKYHFGNKIDGTADDKNKLVITSSDDTVFTVDEYGVMTGIAVGTADLEVNATVRGEKLDALTKSFLVKRSLVLDTDDAFHMERTFSVTAELCGLLDNEEVDLTEAESIEVISPDGKAEGIVIKENGKVYLEITGLRVSETSVTIKATVDGVVGSLTVPVIVYVPVVGSDAFKLDFVNGAPADAATAMLNVHGWNVNYDRSDKGAVKNEQWGMLIYGLKTQLELNEKLVLDFMVRKNGNYAVNLTGHQFGNYGATVAIYIDDSYMGQVCFSHPSDSSSDSVTQKINETLNSVYLPMGTHTVTLKRINEHDERHAFLWWSSLEFSLLEENIVFDDVRAQVGKETLCIGESTEIFTQAVMSDGSIRLFGELLDGSEDKNNSITITNSNPEVAEIRDGRIYALSMGNTTVTVSAKVDGTEKSRQVKVFVDDDKLSTLSASLNQDVYIGKQVEIALAATTGRGREIDVSALGLVFSSEKPEIAEVSQQGIVTGVSKGNTTVTVKASLNGEEVEDSVEIAVLEDGIIEIKATAMPRLIRPDSLGTQICVEGVSYKGSLIELTDAEISYSTQADDIVDVSDTGWVTPKVIGQAPITVTVKQGNSTWKTQITIVVTNGKTGRSYYTDEKVANALENIEKYAWAKRERDSLIESADFHVENLDMLYNWITTQELPRCRPVGYRHDPDMYTCRYCGNNLQVRYGTDLFWIFDPINSPWKIQCPDCRRKFPSNDFWSFYQLGITEDGTWSYAKAHEENAKIVASGGEGFLVNQLYPEAKEKFGDPNWGVDDGYGYKTGKLYSTANGEVEESHTYIGYYNRVYMKTYLASVINVTSKAYLFTGKAQYGRVAAILLDRIADVYPDMQIEPYFPNFYNTDSTSPYGKLVGCIGEYEHTSEWAVGYDAVWPMYDDPEVIRYLSEKAKKYNMQNPKNTPELIRQNIEDGILREIYKATIDGDNYGNFGTYQVPLARAAVVLDTMPETKEMLDYLMAKDEKSWRESDHTGGDMLYKLFNQIDRDGGTYEGLAPGYSILWSSSVDRVAQALNGYSNYAAADLFKHPIYQKMLESHIRLILARKATVAAGDSGSTAGLDIKMPSLESLINGFRATGSTILAQTVYFANGNSVKNLHENIFAKNPEEIQDEILDIIAEHGEFPLDDSDMLAGSGFAVLRDGGLYGEDSIEPHDNQRDFWMCFAIGGQHGHCDSLNLGMHAYGLDVAPELGYPTVADGSDENRNWGKASINHNLVVVNDQQQKRLSSPGKPMHFDDADMVKVMDIDSSDAYKETDIYRRTVVMVKVNDDISYGIDFFRVKGGSEHVYSFHSLSNNISGYSDHVNMTQQKAGTYAGEDVPYRTSGISNGYSYLTDVRRSDTAGNEFFVDFEVTDFRRTLTDSKDMHLRLTMLNDFEISELAFAKGETPKRDNNPRWLEFMLARRSSEKGESLDSTFTTVLEPYKGERYIKNASRIANIKRSDGEDINSNGDVVSAVKIELENGKTDYIIYATNNQVEYVIDEKIVFRGFVGVASYNAEGMQYSYICDGVKLSDVSDGVCAIDEEINEYTASVINFSRDVAFESEIVIRPDLEMDIDSIKGRWMYVENDGVSNGAYLIKDARIYTQEDAEKNLYENAQVGDVIIELGNVTLVRSAENVTATNGDYSYNIVPNQYVSIPLSASCDTSPEFNKVPDVNVSEGREFTTIIKATSPSNKHVELSANTLPRGASFDPKTGVISWTPDNRQIGEHHFAITASDGTMESSLHFTVTVYKSTGTGSGTGISTGGASEDAGGNEASGDEVTSPENTAGTGDGEDRGFIDLDGYSWAKEAIYRLVDLGVVNGTSVNTYSPDANIKRADFAIMLTRAFKVAKADGENFADVDESKYYAEELRCAKIAGIVNGVGNDKFNPEGEITRQDMMLMLYRALVVQGYEMSEPDMSVLAEFADAAQISDYAKDAVAVLVKDGVITGSGGRINPLDKATRAEIAVMLARVIK